MKNKMISLMAFLMFAFGYSQELKPKFEQEGDLIKGTYFFENGAIKQIGYFSNNKLHGEWVSYDSEGNKTTIAHYENGKKTGVWLILANGVVKQVTFDSNKVIDVKDLEGTDLAFTN